MILGSEIQAITDIEPMLEFYKKHYSSVEVLQCSKCNEYLAVEVAGGDGMGMTPNEIGKFVIPVGNKLLSYRVRLDENQEGERMIGYQCACGNDTRLSKAEIGIVPAGLHQVTLNPFEKDQIRQQIRMNKKYKAKFRRDGMTKHYDTFALERVK